MNILLKGAAVASALSDEIKKKVRKLSDFGVVPCLAILRVGAREDDLSYERGAINRCEKTGISVKKVVLPIDVTQNELIGEIEKLNNDDNVHGVLIFRPLPKHIDDRAACAALSPEKDVDGITDKSMAKLYSRKNSGFAPCTAQACIELLKYYNIPVSGKKVTVVGRSLVIGRPVSILLLSENATVTICHRHTKDLPEACREADILVVATGKMGLVGAECTNTGQTVIDVGIHMGEDGKLCGDVRFDETAEICEAITPVPGGVGSVTTSVLAKHVVQAAERKVNLI